MKTNRKMRTLRGWRLSRTSLQLDWMHFSSSAVRAACCKKTYFKWLFVFCKLANMFFLCIFRFLCEETKLDARHDKSGADTSHVTCRRESLKWSKNKVVICVKTSVSALNIIRVCGDKKAWLLFHTNISSPCFREVLGLKQEHLVQKAS